MIETAGSVGPAASTRSGLRTGGLVVTLSVLPKGLGGEEPSRPVERAEVAVVVRAAVSNLGGRQRTAVELHQFEDRTYTEVAARMDMSPEAAKSLLYRARNQLRETLAGYMKEAD